MLILKRQWEEAVIIYAGEHRIVIKVTEIRDGHVKLGFIAESTVRILREELERNSDAAHSKRD
jgi:carbon storage regulator CsrA